jgi:hypothetical protein
MAVKSRAGAPTREVIMKRVLAAAALSAAFLAVPFSAMAQAPPYSNGPVWDVSQIRTKDGRFDDYIKWVSTAWKAQEEALMKAGYIIGYKVYTVVDPRDGEPDILLCTEYKNMAVMDTPVAQMYAWAAKHLGSTKQQNQGEVSRGSMRTVMGDVLMRELILK